MKKKTFLCSLLLVVTLVLAACSKNSSSQNKSQLPSATTILNGAQKTKINNFESIWQQTNQNHKVSQKAEVKFCKQPFVIYANFTTNNNHYQMWGNHKNSFIQMQGTATKKWFKTKLSKTASYRQLSDALITNALQTLDQIKKFQVNKTNQGYQLTYQGRNQKLWQDLLNSAVITSVIGLDQNNVKLKQIKINLQTDHHYNLTSLKLDNQYQENKENKNIQIKIDQINKSAQLKIPNKVTKSAVDLGSSSN